MNDSETSTHGRAIHRRFADALTTFERDGDADELVELYADDCEVGNIVLGEAHRGHDGARRFWNAYRDQFDSIESNFLVVAGDDHGAVLEWESTGTANGDDVAYRGATVLEYTDGAIARSMAYYDPHAVGRQLVDGAETARSADA